MMFSFFKKKPKADITIIPPVPITIEINPETKEKTFAPKVNVSRSKFVMNHNIVDGVCEGYIISTEIIDKYNAKVYNVVLYVKHGKRLDIPQLKCIDKRNCKKIESTSISMYDKKYFNINNWDTVKCNFIGDDTHYVKVK